MAVENTDEISVKDFVIGIRENIKIILFIVLVSLSSGAAYIALKKPVYVSTAVLTKPNVDASMENITYLYEYGFNTFEPNYIFERVVNLFKSKSEIGKYFSQNILWKSDDNLTPLQKRRIIEGFLAKNVSVEFSELEENLTIAVAMEDPEQAEKHLRGLVDFIDKRAKEINLSEFEAVRKVKLRKIDASLELAKEVIVENRQRRFSRFDEALKLLRLSKSVSSAAQETAMMTMFLQEDTRPFDLEVFDSSSKNISNNNSAKEDKNKRSSTLPVAGNNIVQNALQAGDTRTLEKWRSLTEKLEAPSDTYSVFLLDSEPNLGEKKEPIMRYVMVMACLAGLALSTMYVLVKELYF